MEKYATRRSRRDTVTVWQAQAGHQAQRGWGEQFATGQRHAAFHQVFALEAAVVAQAQHIGGDGDWSPLGGGELFAAPRCPARRA